MPASYILDIGGVRSLLKLRAISELLENDPCYGPFFSTIDHITDHDLSISVDISDPPDMTDIPMLFDNGSSWSFYRDSRSSYIKLYGMGHDDILLVAEMNGDIEEVSIKCDERFIIEGAPDIISANPVRYPLDQILLMYHLSNRRGLIVHAAGSSINNRGLIFAGRSGSGKSTISRLIAERSKEPLLSDDRVVIRGNGNGYFAYGTPWPGEEGIASNSEVEVGGLFFIHHGTENIANEISPIDAIERLLPAVSSPWFDRETVAGILSSCDDLIRNVPCYDLHFYPDHNLFDFVKEILS